MKKHLNICGLCTFIAIINLAYGAPVAIEPSAELRNLEVDLKTSEDGGFHYKYELTDNQSQDVEGIVKEVNGEKILIMKGYYTFHGDDGYDYKISYIADENGYRITGFEKTLAIQEISINVKAVNSLLG